MPSHRTGLRRSLAAVAVTLLAVVAGGCMRPLALQHEYFRSASGPAARSSVQARHVVGHHRALQAAQRACSARVPAAEPPVGPDLGRAAAREALAEVCADTVARTAPVSAHGATSNAYRRWVQDEVRPLPAPSETAAPAAGG